MMVKRRPKSDIVSIARAVREEVENDSLIQEAFARGIVNTSAAARAIRPSLRQRLAKEVSEEAIIASLKRLRGAYRVTPIDYLKILAKSSVEVRTDLALVSVRVTPKTTPVLKDLIFKNYDSILQTSSSPNAYTIVFERQLFSHVSGRFEEDDTLEAKTDMASLIIHSPEKILDTPGCVAAIYDKLARASINVDDTVSDYTDTIVVVKMEDVVKAFKVLTDLIVGARSAGER